MNLIFEEFELARNIVEECLKLDDDKIDTHLQEGLKFFSEGLDMSNLDNRGKISSFLGHQSFLFMNFHLNGNVYLLGEKEQKKCEIDMKSITDLRKGFMESGL